MLVLTTEIVHGRICQPRPAGIVHDCEAVQAVRHTPSIRDMDEQMLTCLHRITMDPNRLTNVMSEWNKDFRLMYKVLSRQRNEAKRVSDSTGVELDATKFIKLFYDNQQLLRDNKELLKRVASAGEEFPRLHSLVSETQEAGPASSSRVNLLRRVAPQPRVLS